MRYCATDPILSSRKFLTAPMQRLASRHPRWETFAAMERALRPAALAPHASKSIFWAGHYHFLAASPQRFNSRVVTIHDLLPLEHPEWFPPRESVILRKALKRIAKEDWFVVFDTQHVREKGAALADIQLSRSTVISPGIDHGLFCPPRNEGVIHHAKELLGIPRATPYFLTLSTREPRKGLGTAVRAFIQAAQGHLIPDDSELIIVGSQGWGTHDFDAALAAAGDLRHRIRLLGFVPDQHLPALYAGALAFLFPSLAEGFGFPPLEAMASGCLVLSSNASCMPEVLGNAAYFLPPLNVDEWANALARFSCADPAREALLKAGTVQAGRYRWSSTASAMSSVFNDLADEPNRQFSTAHVNS
jgi:glycosyltransferase involved in cell wall biosynthesis